MHFNFKEEKGFTIIELIISIFVLSVAVVGIFSVFSMITILTSDTADRLTATYLAQEGMEIVRNIRDTNWLKMDANNCVSEDTYDCLVSWVDDLTTGACGSPGGCGADYTSTSMSGNAVDYLNLNDAGFYDYYQSGDEAPTKFKRKIIITPVTDVDGDANHIIKVIVQASWDKKATILNNLTNPPETADTCSLSNCITAEATLYDWYNYVHH